MNIILKRRFKGPEYTIGSIYIDGKLICDSLEDRDRGLNQNMSLKEIQSKKVYGETAIPIGTYEISMNTISPKFKNRSWAKPYGGKIPRLLNVPGFDGILIHPGNQASESLGCIFPGENKVKGKVLNSTIYFNKIMNILLQAKDKITITIE